MVINYMNKKNSNCLVKSLKALNTLENKYKEKKKLKEEYEK
jgi:hypothetical protein